MSKMHTLIIKPNAIEDIRAIKNWYNEQSLGLGDKFVANIDESLVRIAHHPHSFAKIYKKLRRISLKKFPFHVGY